MEILRSNKMQRQKYCSIYLIILLHCIFWGSICLSFIGLEITLLQQISGYIYLTFIPGYLIMRIINFKSLEIIDLMLFSVGFSITILMGVGLFLNHMLPLVGITRPISFVYILISLSLLTGILTLYLLYREKSQEKICISPIRPLQFKLSPQILFLFLVPFISLFSSYWMRVYSDNMYQMILIVIISAIIIYIAYQKITNPTIYLVAIYVISISLMFHSSLISNYLVEWGDLATEYWYANAVINTGVWNYQDYRTVNSMLSIVILPPIYSILLGIDVLWVFKVIFPLIFSFVPLGIYQIVKKQTNDKIGFLSAIFFISMFSNYSAMLGANRQQIGELFIILITLTLVTFQEGERVKQSLLIICFGLSLIVSHYALTYIYIAVLVLAYVIIRLLCFAYPHLPSVNLRFITKSALEEQVRATRRKLINSPLLRPNVILIILISCFAWYYYINSSAFDTLLKIGSMILPSITSEFLNPSSVQGLEIIIRRSTHPIDFAYKFIHLMAIALIILGLLTALVKKEDWKFNPEYLFLSIPFCLIGVVSVTVPYFASALNTSRLYQISLLILAPFCIIGGLAFLRRVRLTRKTSSCCRIIIVTLFIVIYLLFNLGFVHQIAGSPQSFSLDTNNVIRPHYSEKDIAIAEYISKLDYKHGIYSDLSYAYLLQTKNGKFTPLLGTEGIIMTRIKIGDYILIGELNSETNEIIVGDRDDPRLTFTKVTIYESGLSSYLDHANKIISTGNSNIYHNLRLGVNN